MPEENTNPVMQPHCLTKAAQTKMATDEWVLLRAKRTSGTHSANRAGNCTLGGCRGWSASDHLHWPGDFPEPVPQCRSLHVGWDVWDLQSVESTSHLRQAEDHLRCWRHLAQRASGAYEGHLVGQFD